ncbi:hypothetical protein BDZ91DRAFT_764729 [Kalaharituber pfeilii]|nr:hypothetical protein BDZ91DRAFT_764729 [Kalaharituber pfeilii]
MSSFSDRQSQFMPTTPPVSNPKAGMARVIPLRSGHRPNYSEREASTIPVDERLLCDNADWWGTGGAYKILLNAVFKIVSLEADRLYMVEEKNHRALHKTLNEFSEELAEMKKAFQKHVEELREYYEAQEWADGEEALQENCSTELEDGLTAKNLDTLGHYGADEEEGQQDLELSRITEESAQSDHAEDGAQFSQDDEGSPFPRSPRMVRPEAKPAQNKASPPKKPVEALQLRRLASQNARSQRTGSNPPLPSSNEQVTSESAADPAESEVASGKRWRIQERPLETADTHGQNKNAAGQTLTRSQIIRSLYNVMEAEGEDFRRELPLTTGIQFDPDQRSRTPDPYEKAPLLTVARTLEELVGRLLKEGGSGSAQGPPGSGRKAAHASTGNGGGPAVSKYVESESERSNAEQPNKPPSKQKPEFSAKPTPKNPPKSTEKEETPKKTRKIPTRLLTPKSAGAKIIPKEEVDQEVTTIAIQSSATVPKAQKAKLPLSPLPVHATDIEAVLEKQQEALPHPDSEMIVENTDDELASITAKTPKPGAKSGIAKTVTPANATEPKVARRKRSSQSVQPDYSEAEDGYNQVQHGDADSSIGGENYSPKPARTPMAQSKLTPGKARTKARGKKRGNSVIETDVDSTSEVQSAVPGIGSARKGLPRASKRKKVEADREYAEPVSDVAGEAGTGGAVPNDMDLELDVLLPRAKAQRSCRSRSLQAESESEAATGTSKRGTPSAQGGRRRGTWGRHAMKSETIDLCTPYKMWQNELKNKYFKVTLKKIIFF